VPFAAAGRFAAAPEYDQAYAAAQKVYFETDIARVMSPEMQRIISERGLYADGQTLEQTLDAATWQQVKDYCAKAGLPAASVNRMKPWLLTIMIAAMELQKLGVSQEGADAIYFKRAKADGKPAAGLEEFEHHVDLITRIGAGREAELIRSTFEDLAQSIADSPQLLAAWRQGDLAAIEKHVLEEMRTKYPDIFRDLIVTRNNAWLVKIDDLLKSPETELILVGFGHLAGPEGLIAQLRGRGCEITQLQAAK
jgi:uncharacterized protein YbaP (TraB family)